MHTHEIRGVVSDIRVNLTPRPGGRLLVRVWVVHRTPKGGAPWQMVDSWVLGNSQSIRDLEDLYAAVHWAVGERALPGLDNHLT